MEQRGIRSISTVFEELLTQQLPKLNLDFCSVERDFFLYYLFIFFPLPFFFYGEKYNNYIVSLNRCWTSESFSFSRRKGIIIVFFLLLRWKFSILFPYFLLLSLSPHFSKKEISWQLRYVRINRGKYPGEQRVYI